MENNNMLYDEILNFDLNKELSLDLILSELKARCIIAVDNIQNLDDENKVSHEEIIFFFEKEKEYLKKMSYFLGFFGRPFSSGRYYTGLFLCFYLDVNSKNLMARLLCKRFSCEVETKEKREDPIYNPFFDFNSSDFKINSQDYIDHIALSCFEICYSIYDHTKLTN